jgi:hypothetical protein
VRGVYLRRQLVDERKKGGEESPPLHILSGFAERDLAVAMLDARNRTSAFQHKPAASGLQSIPVEIEESRAANR